MPLYRALGIDADWLMIPGSQQFFEVTKGLHNAFQHCSDVVLQKSVREGFGLVVSESLWKGTPVVAGRAGGIPMQMPEGVGGHLIDSIDDCVEKTVRLLKDRREAQELGMSGRNHVKQHYLVTRLLADDLQLLASVA